MTAPEPLRIESIASRFVGGRRVELSGLPVRDVALSGALATYRYDPNDTFHIEQAYLQRIVPADRVQDEPVVFVHGGGMTGVCWETTPDGRPGWVPAFLRAGVPVEVLDNVERGRAGWSSLPGTWPGEPILRGEREMWVAFRIGPPEGYESRTPFAGSLFPVDRLDALACQSVPRWPGNGELAERSLRAVVDDIGPCVLVGHSQGGGLCAQVAASRPELVRALVLLEPHGLPEPGSLTAPQPPLLTVIGDNVEHSAMYVDLVDRMHRHADEVRATGAVADVLDLPATGVRGNSHNLMMDANSDDVAGRVLDWLADRR